MTHAQSQSHAVEVDRTTTELPPCVVQVHPVNPRILLVGTYDLDKSERTRRGSIDVYMYEDSKLRLAKSCAIRSAVLDLQIKPDQPDIVVSAQSTGQVVVWKLHGWDPQQTSSLSLALSEQQLLSSTNSARSSLRSPSSIRSPSGSGFHSRTGSSSAPLTDKKGDAESGYFAGTGNVSTSPLSQSHSYSQTSNLSTSPLSLSTAYSHIPTQTYSHAQSSILSAHSTATTATSQLNYINRIVTPGGSKSEGVYCEVIKEHQLFDAGTLVLSIRFAAHDPSLLSVTLSSGEVALLKITDAGDIKLLAQNQSHTLESWTSAFGETNDIQNILFSGGDDSMLVSHDTRLMSMEHESGVIWSSMRLHDAGITSILPSSTRTGWMKGSPLCLYTGGYDDQLVSVDLRLGPQNCLDKYVVPKVESKTNLGGGVWRLVPKPDPSSRSSIGSVSLLSSSSIGDPHHQRRESNSSIYSNGNTSYAHDYSDQTYNNEVLACCMYGGARALTVSPKSKQPSVYRTIEKGHSSMVYGGDWIGESDEVVVCSFYDKQLAVWDMSRGQ